MRKEQASKALLALKLFPKSADKALARYINSWAKHPIKTLGGTALAGTGATLGGGALTSIFYPEVGKKVTSNLMYGPKKALQEAVSAGAQQFADTMTKEHIKTDKAGKPVLDPKTRRPVIVPGVVQRLSKAFTEHMSPALVKPVNKLSWAMGVVAQKSGQIGSAFGKNLGEGFKSTGGKVLTGAGGAALGYTAMDLLQDLFASKKQTEAQKRRRRVLNILAAVAAGGASAYHSDKLYKMLDE